MTLTRCPNCGGRLRKEERERARHVAEHTFTMPLPAQVCGSCGESYYQQLDMRRFDLEVARRLTEAGIVAPEAVQFVRKATGVRGKELAELLDVRPETVSRWETGRRPMDRASLAVLHALVAEQLAGLTSTRDYLEQLGKARRLPKTVRLERE